MSKPLYVVTALHNTGHGPATSVILVTEDQAKAVARARTAEELSYEFNYGSGVYVYKVALGVTYDHKPGSLTRPHRNPTNDDSLVFYRVRDRDWSQTTPIEIWREEFV